MDAPNFSHSGDQGYPSEQRESHWQPALRPNAHDSVPSISMSDHPSESDTIARNSHQEEIGDAHRWDEDSNPEQEQRLDPAWGFKRTDSAHILDNVIRSPSFPDLPAEVSTASQEPTIQESRDFIGDEAQQSDGVLPLEPEVAAQILQDEDRTEPVTDDLVTTTLEPENEEQMRFEEGLPLLSSDEPPKTDAPEPSVPDAFEDIDADEDTSFFSQIQTEPTGKSGTAPVFDRKSTSDVLQTLDFRHDGAESPSAITPEVDDFAALLADKELSTTEKPDEVEDLWAAALSDDDFLGDDDDDDLLPDSDSEEGSTSSFLAAIKASTEQVPEQKPAQNQPPQTTKRPENLRGVSNPYAPHQPSTAELTQLSPRTAGNIGLPRPTLPPMGSFQAQLQREEAIKAESFSDQSKGGYKSPYDLPMDLAPKRRPQMQKETPAIKAIAPPPRSSSMSSDKQLQSPFTPTTNVPTQFPPTPPIQNNISPVQRISNAPAPRPASTTARSTSSTFFEELPLIQKARPSPAPGRYTPSHNTVAPPPPRGLVQSPPVVRQPSIPHPVDAQPPYQLQAPERLDPYANVPLQTASESVPVPAPAPAPALVPSTNRYSPAPPTLQNGIRPSPSPRYSPAPPPAGGAGHSRYASQPIPNASMPPSSASFQPRTSSPLAQHRRSVDEVGGATSGLPPRDPMQSSGFMPPTQNVPSLIPTQPTYVNSPPRTVETGTTQPYSPPRRSQTQSPSQQSLKPMYASKAAPPPHRPASAFGQIPPSHAAAKSSVSSTTQNTYKTKAPAQELDFIKPQDETQFDVLERWKGAPIFKFGFGGQIIQSFPKHTPRFGVNSLRPQIKPSSGEVLVKKSNQSYSLPEHVTTFPGPLRGKSKKKDVLTWMATRIVNLESQPASSLPGEQIAADQARKHDEKVLLWKLLKVFVEHDGSFESTQALEAVNKVLMPELYALDETNATQYQPNDPLAGIYRPSGANVKTEVADPQVLETLRKTLLRGKREDAVWLAVDNKIWSHAMIIASTLDTSVWRQVIQEFVRQEVKTTGSNTEPLCALYEVFGGNLEDSIDQLVPPSARAGLQMVSKVDSGGPMKNALDGLNRWKETLCLVLNNRSRDDQRALATMASLLSDYGRTEAAHICYLFAKSSAVPQIFGGADEQQTSIVLLGADHVGQPADFYRDTDSILLTEVYEFAINTLSSTSGTSHMPQLAVYKLQRANELADSGFKLEAQAYCDAIASGLKTNTKQSLYYHPLLLGEVEDLSNRLKQIPVPSSSWMAKPSIEKVSGSMWNKFSSFVAGEDSDAESKGSVRDPGESGPFANVTGSPSISRTGSQTDLYGSYPTMAPTVQSAAGSRYAPNGLHSARSSSELTRGRASLDQQRSPPSTSHSNDARSLYAPNIPSQPNVYSPLGVSPSGSASSYTPSIPHHEHQQSSYTPSIPFEQIPVPPPEPISADAQLFNQSLHPTYSDQAPLQSELSPVVEEKFTFDPPEQSYGGYEPPANTYVPYEPEPDSDDDAVRTKPKKKAFINDNDDDFPSMTNASSNDTAAPPKNSEAAPVAARKKANDEAADAAFRAAAEADAKRAKDQASQKKASGSWLGGWFGGKKSESLDSGPKGGEPKVHKVHLGDTKKIYYDEKLKKWVNPDNPDASAPKSTPPPPRAGTPAGGPPPPPMGPPRSVPSPLPPGPPSRNATPAADSDSSRPGSSQISATLPPSVSASLGLGTSGTLGPPTGASSAPTPNLPSRPASSMSNASDLDGLLGGPATGGRKGAGGRTAKAKKGRYVDVMAK